MRYHRTGKTWSSEEEQQLMDEIKEGFSIKALCISHARSRGSILDRMRKRNLIFRHVQPYLPVETEVMEEIPSTPVSQRYICVFDTETTGKDIPFAQVSETAKWDKLRMVQFAYELYTPEGDLIDSKCLIIKPDNYSIPDEAIAIHGITNERAQLEGVTIQTWCEELNRILPHIETLVAHNLEFDTNVIQSELYRAQQFFLVDQWKRKETDCTMLMGKRYMGRWTKLAVLAQECNLIVPSGLHQADVDTHLCAQIYFYLRNKHITNQRHLFRISMEDKQVFKLLGGRWDAGQKHWYMDEAEPYFRYVKQWFMS